MQPRKLPVGRRPRRAAPLHGRTLRYRAPPPYVYPRRGAGAPADEDITPGRPPFGSAEIGKVWPKAILRNA
jgi:hypothetical protein